MKQLIYLLILMALISHFWHQPVLYPLKLLIVFFHESSHALATLLTGGSVKEFVINHEQGGYVVSQGGIPFIILSAGYIGSLLWGILIYALSVYSLYDKAIMYSLATSMIIMTVFLASSVFSWLFGLGAAMAMLVVASFLSEQSNDFLLRLIGLTSMMYAPLDIYSDTISRSHLQSDAYLLAQHSGGTTLFWGWAWIIISLISIFYCLKWSLLKAS